MISIGGLKISDGDPCVFMVDSRVFFDGEVDRRERGRLFIIDCIGFGQVGVACLGLKCLAIWCAEKVVEWLRL